MTVIRVQRKKKDFFVAKTEALNSTGLSLKAKGLCQDPMTGVLWFPI